MIDMKKLIFCSFLSISALMAGGDILVLPDPIEPAIDDIMEPIETIQPNPYYLGLGLHRGDYRGCVHIGCKYEDVTFGIMGRAGYEWNQYIGAEARMLATFWGADPLGGQKLLHGGLFVKPMYPLGEDFNFYGLLGYGWTKSRTGGNGNLKTIDEGGLSAGLGLEYDLSSKKEDREVSVDYNRTFDGQANQENGWGVFMDYQRLLIKSNTPNVDSISIGFIYDF